MKLLITVDSLLLGFNALLMVLTYRLCGVLELLNADSRKQAEELQNVWRKIAATMGRPDE